MIVVVSQLAVAIATKQTNSKHLKDNQGFIPRGGSSEASLDRPHAVPLFSHAERSASSSHGTFLRQEEGRLASPRHIILHLITMHSMQIWGGGSFSPALDETLPMPS